MTEIGTGGRLYADAPPPGVDDIPMDISALWSPPTAPTEPVPVKVRRNWTEFWSNGAELTGIGSISAGFWLITPAYGLISAGVGLLALGVAAGR